MSASGLRARARDSLLARGLRNSRGRLGLALILLIVALSLIGPAFAPYAPSELVDAPFQLPGAGLLLGSDGLGRDVLSRFLYGGRDLVWMSASATVIGIALGTVAGIAAAYFRGPTEAVLMRLADLMLAFPSIVFALLFVTMFGPSRLLLVALVGVLQAPSVARVMRGAALAVIGRDYILWAKSIGLSPARIIATEVLPNVTSPLLVEAGLRFTWAISLLAGLSFLGYGIQPPEADWGLMINESRNALGIQPFAALMPILAIGVLAMGGNFLAEGLARAAGRTDGALG